MMGIKEFFKEVFKIMFPKKVKWKEREGVIGHYDCKPFHNFRYALIYADETKVFDNEKIEIFARVFKKNTTFINILVNEETEDFNIDDYKLDNLLPLLEGFTYHDPKDGDLPFEKTDNYICVILFQHLTDKAIASCKKYCNSTKQVFEQGLIYNPEYVHMDFYKPVPKFYRLYDKFCEDIYFDLAFIDDTRS